MPMASEIIFEPTEVVKKRLKIEHLRSKEHIETKENFRFHTEIN